MYSLKHLARAAAVGSVLAVVACEADREVVGPALTGGEIFRNYVALGNSITAGWQSGGINDSTQQQAYPRLLATQMGTPYRYASLVAPGCPPPVANFQTQARVGTGSTGTTCLVRSTASVTDVLNNVGVGRSKDGKYILIPDDGFTSSESRAIPTSNPFAAPIVLAARRPNVEYQIDHVDGAFLMTTNDGAQNFKVMRIADDQIGKGQWTEFIPTSDSVFIEYLEPFKNHLVVVQRSGGLRRLRVMDLKTKRAPFYITFPEAAYAVGPTGNAKFDSDTLRFAYQSMVTPSTTYDYAMSTRQRVVKKKLEVPGFDPSKYEVKRFMVRARDGVMVPVSMIVGKGWKQDGTHPLLEYAYGSYGSTTEAGFNSSVLSLVDRGFGYAIAHIRGGQEMGRAWYDQGKMMNKKNTFNDFVDVGQYLVDNKFTSKDRLIANGGSAGGLLMGAVVNMRPDLFKAVVADVPFVDVINTMMDASIPLTAQEWQQWGDPHDATQYAYMRSYSPYDNVERKAYPWMLVTTSLNDSQVGYWEPAKWVAKLRSMKTDSNPLYIKINMAGGHGGSSGRYDVLRERAFRYAFMLDAVGITQ